jgi:predicted HicB family RNase H-like nuclease
VSPKKRFSYLKSDTNDSNDDQTPSNDTAETSDTAASPISEDDSLRSVPRGEGRMAQAREQLNVRIPTLLKRKAVAKAILEGRTIGDVVEALLASYVDDADDT